MERKRMPRILLADDHALVRKGFRDCLALMEDEEGRAPEIVEASSLKEVTTVLENGRPFDLVILDLYMPGMNAMQGLDVMRERWPNLPVAVISGSIAREDVVGSLDRGAVGFIPKSLDLPSIQSAVHLMLAGDRYLPSVLLDWFGEGTGDDIPAVPGLTKREGEVWSYLKDGHSNKEIARLMGLQEVTVKVHVSSLFRKLGVRNRTQATTLFLKTTNAQG